MKKVDPSELQLDVIFEEALEGGFSVYVPTLPGCISEGDTFEEARENIIEAISLYLEDLDKEEVEYLSSSNDHYLITKIEVPVFL